MIIESRCSIVLGGGEGGAIRLTLQGQKKMKMKYKGKEKVKVSKTLSLIVGWIWGTLDKMPGWPVMERWSAIPFVSLGAGSSITLTLKFIRIFLVEVNTHLNWTFDWQTALHHAARNGHLRCLKVLIDAGARVDIKNKDGKTAMQIAFEMGEIDCGNYLRTMEGILSSKKALWIRIPSMIFAFE